MDFLISIRFICCPTDQTIFISDATKVIIGIHIDDLLITGSSNYKVEKLKEQLKGQTKMKDLGKARHILGMIITQTNEYLKIDQLQYAKSIVRDFAMFGSKIYSTPMASDAIGELENTSGNACTGEELVNYWKLLGKLLYL